MYLYYAKLISLNSMNNNISYSRLPGTMVYSQMASLHGGLIHIPLHFNAVIKVTVAQEAISPSCCKIDTASMQKAKHSP